jgi:hypothetical protein
MLAWLQGWGHALHALKKNGRSSPTSTGTRRSLWPSFCERDNMSNDVIILGSGTVGMACAWAALPKSTSVRVIDRAADSQDAVARIEQRMALGETA